MTDKTVLNRFANSANIILYKNPNIGSSTIGTMILFPGALKIRLFEQNRPGKILHLLAFCLSRRGILCYVFVQLKK
jgi:hypothetical protein